MRTALYTFWRPEKYNTNTDALRQKRNWNMILLTLVTLHLASVIKHIQNHETTTYLSASLQMNLLGAELSKPG